MKLRLLTLCLALTASTASAQDWLSQSVMPTSHPYLPPTYGSGYGWGGINTSSPKFYHPGYGYVLPSNIYNPVLYSYSDGYSFGQKNPSFSNQNGFSTRADSYGGPWYFPGSSTNFSTYRFRW